jgi:hypothetical protein
VIDIPETRYAETVDGAHVAYQVWGGGPLDLVVVPSAYVPVDMMWEEPQLQSLLERLRPELVAAAVRERGRGHRPGLSHIDRAFSKPKV